MKRLHPRLGLALALLVSASGFAPGAETPSSSFYGVDSALSWVSRNDQDNVAQLAAGVGFSAMRERLS